MTARLLGKIALRLLAVYLIARGISVLPDVYAIPIQFGDKSSLGFNPYFLFIIPICALLIAGIVLWAMAPLISDWMVGTSVVSTQMSLANVEEIQRVAIGTAGLIIAIIAIPQVVSWLIRTVEDLYLLKTQQIIFGSHNWAYLVAALLQLLLGLLLIFGTRSLARLLRRAREFGLEGSK